MHVFLVCFPVQVLLRRGERKCGQHGVHDLHHAHHLHRQHVLTWCKIYATVKNLKGTILVSMLLLFGH